MTVEELLSTRVRLSIIDDAVKPYIISDAEMIGHYNDVMNDLCSELPLIADSLTTEICQIAVTTVLGTTYAINPRITKIRKAFFTPTSDATKITELRILPVDVVDLEKPNWSLLDADTPTILINDLDVNSVTLVPAPDEDGMITLRVYRLPVTDLTTDDDLSTESPEILTQYHGFLAHAIAAKCFGKQDSDIFDANKEATQRGLWATAKEQIKRDVIRSKRGGEMISLHQGFY